MKTILVFAAVCVLSLAVPVKHVPKKYKIGDKVFLEKQTNVLRLFKYVNQPTFYKDFTDIAQTFSPENHMDWYTKPEYVKEFMWYYKYDILPRGEVFSVFYPEHLKQAIALFKMMYYAKDYETFFKTAVWARQHVNEGMWLYKFSVAIIHRPDTFGMILPPIYEIYPYYFFNTEVIYKAQQYKQMFDGKLPENGYTIESNYSGWYMNLHPEQSLSYFTEDIGINSCYYYYHIYYPWWMDGDEFNLKADRRGEVYYAIHKQMLARYYLERLSNGFGEIPTIHKGWPIETGYYPSMQYPNGLEFPSRPNNVRISHRWETNLPQFTNFTYAYTYMNDFARRIRDAIDIGHVHTKDGQKVSLYEKDGLEILANMIEGNPDSPNIDYYGVIQMYARFLIGYSNMPINKYKLTPSTLEHFETSLRDPAFYQFYKWMMVFFQDYVGHLPQYTKSDLEFPGVKVESVQVDRLITYFDWFYSDLTHGVWHNENEFETDAFKVNVRQARLNHKPFTVTINVDSDKATESVVRMYIGPKYDEHWRTIDINENRMNFVLLDKFPFSLKAGKNTITRNSRQSYYYVADRTSYKELYTRVFNAYKGTEEFQIDGSEMFWNLPSRFMLPKGRIGGMPYQLYVIVTPSTKTVEEETHYHMVGTGGHNYIDSWPLGYPFDRFIDVGTFYVDNSHFQDITIYHKKMEDINASAQE